MLFPVLLAAIAAHSSPPPVAVGLATIAEGPRAALVSAREAIGRCRFSQIEIVEGAPGRGALRVPARELGPHQAVCVNGVSDETRLPGVTWTAPDLRQH